MILKVVSSWLSYNRTVLSDDGDAQVLESVQAGVSKMGRCSLYNVYIVLVQLDNSIPRLTKDLFESRSVGLAEGDYLHA